MKITLPQITPGPWATDIIEAIEIIDREGVNSGRKNDHRINQAVVYVNHGSGKGGQIVSLPHDPEDGLDLHDPEYIANAQAIAALPDLLAALADTLQRIEDSEHWWTGSPDRGGMDAERIRSALLKARATITE